MTQTSPERHPVLVQAPVRALDPDGVAVVGSGTVAFVIGAVVCWVFRDGLAATGRDWYLGVALAGVALGLIGLAVGLTRRHRRVRPARQEPAEQLEP